MIGLGMTLTGACPGTVLVQLATGIRSGWYVMAGGGVGGIVYNRLVSHLRKSEIDTTPVINLTVYGKFNVKKHYAVLVYGLMCLTITSAVTVLASKEAPVGLHPLLGGILIGAAQAASLILTGTPVGVSTGYEVLGFHVGEAFGSLSGHKSGKPPASMKSVYFGSGIVMGSYVFALSIPSSILETGANISPARGMFGGFVMILGARLAGGCTSGHGISGMSMLSISSMITVTFMFIGGFGAALFL